MENFKNNKKTLVFILSLFLITITACTNDFKNEIKSDSYRFEKDSSLSKFINIDIQNDVLESKIRTVPLKLAFVNDNYVGVLNSDGVLIYKIEDKKISSAIDIKGLGFNRTQGDGAIDISSNNEYLILRKHGNKKGYIYSFADNYLSTIDDISKIKTNKTEKIDVEEINKFKSQIIDEDELLDSIKLEDRYIILVIDSTNLKNSYLIEFDKNYDVVTKFKIT